MKLFEHEAADIFAGAGIPVPERMVVDDPEKAIPAAVHLGGPMVVKAQVLTGGRGLAGGVKRADTPDEAHDAAAAILGSTIRGLPVDKVLLSRRADIERELYLGITVDGYAGRPVVVACAEGGMSIEEVAARLPEKIASLLVDPFRGLFAYEARALLKRAGFPPSKIGACADILVKLFNVFDRYHALIAEINPLAVCRDGSLAALDAKLEIDDSALARVKDILPRPRETLSNPFERKAAEIGVSYVDLDGDIGIIASGAGLGMATMDIIGRKYRPANFLETGGGITEDLLYKTMELIMMKPGLRAVFINLYGGINPIHEGAKGIVRYLREHPVSIPIVAKALGNRQEETWDILRSGGVHVVTEVATERAVERLFALVEDLTRPSATLSTSPHV
jgi:succinyl-CoA synthetase beta subunit